MKKFLSRKFIIIQECLLLSFVGLLMGKMSDTVFASILIAAMGVYGAVNVYQKIKVKMGANNDKN